jgi:hypothetical protein
MGLREVQMAGRLELSLADYRALEAGELWITCDLYERIVDLCGWAEVGRALPCHNRKVSRQVTVHRGRHWGWWVEGRKKSGSLFMKTWWPTERIARAIGRLFGGGGASG